MHGPAECIGNMLILCASDLPFPLRTEAAAATAQASSSWMPSLRSPHTPVIRSLGFANCLIDEYPHIPERNLVEGCALEHGIDFEALNQCASQENDDETGGDDGDDDTPLSGIALLRQSALHSDRVAAKKSCTVRLDESVWCVRDGGVWKDCVQNGRGSQVSVLVDQVERLWKERN